MKLLGLVALVLVPALIVVEHHRERRRGRFLPDPPTDYGHAWTVKVREYWAKHGTKHCGRRCLVCGRHEHARFAILAPLHHWLLHGRTFEVHHPHGAGNRYRLGHEPLHALLGVCDGGTVIFPWFRRKNEAGKNAAPGCHERIHDRHHRIKKLGLDAGHKRLPGVTRRAHWLGIWRRSFPTRWKALA